METFFAIVGIILYVDIKYVYGKVAMSESFLWRVLFFILIGLVVLAIVTFMYAFPLLSRFDNKTLLIIRNAAFMSIRHMGYTVPLLLILGLAVFIGWLMFPVSMLFIVGAWVYISSFFLYKVIDRYMPKDEHYDEDYYLGAGEENTDGNAEAENKDTDCNAEAENKDTDGNAEAENKDIDGDADNQL